MTSAFWGSVLFGPLGRALYCSQCSSKGGKSKKKERIRNFNAREGREQQQKGEKKEEEQAAKKDLYHRREENNAGSYRRPFCPKGRKRFYNGRKGGKKSRSRHNSFGRIPHTPRTAQAEDAV